MMTTTSTDIVQRKPYTVVVSWDDDVYMLPARWIEVNNHYQKHGSIAISEANITLMKWQIKYFYEVKPWSHTSVEHWIYSQDRKHRKELLVEHRKRKQANWIGISSIEMWEAILRSLKWEVRDPEKTAEKSQKPIDKKKAKEALTSWRKKIDE